MAQSAKKSNDLTILSDIYHDQEIGVSGNRGERHTVVEKIKAYFNAPQTVEKWLAGAVLFFGAAGIIFGFNHFKSLIARPYDRPAPASNISLANATNQDTQDLLGLRQKDTDQDGLSDYDELYVYQTSPYLEDSDSDGIQDQKEIASNSDPNCPKGADCTGAAVESAEAENTAAATANFDASALRAALQRAGVSSGVLNALSDEELLRTYLDVIGGGTAASTTAAIEGSAQQSSSPSAVDQISQLTPAQLRQLLQEQGVPVETLNRVSDEELLKLVQETLQGY